MKILIIEDEPEIVEVLTVAFEIRWPDVKSVYTHMGEKGVALVESENPDIVILDLGLPDISGFDVLKQIRTFSDVPIIILTVRGEESDVVKGLEWGADDYMTKPFRQLELMSRVQALTRRTGSSIKEQPLTYGRLSFDPATRQLLYGQIKIIITQTEASILGCLIKKAGQIAAYSELAETVWGSDYPDSVNSLRVYIRRLRQKIEKDPDNPQVILTRSGVGYFLVKEG
ncbi:MAG: two component transcriptional regulator, winged helix family [Dehalococcoidales bacterium]|nr:two component transcriptional regulator, winged helix family [Dehalococcoidales bacterium]